MSPDHDHISDLRWDRLLAGELAADEASAARAHADGCTRCATRLRELTTERDAFTIRPQVVAFARRPRRAARAGWIGAAVGAVAAAAIAIVVLRPRDPEPGERTKGAGPELVVAVGRAPQLTPVSSGDTVFAGDTLQAAYTSSRDGFGAVIARDGAGGVFAYSPAVGDAMPALPAGENRSFPQSTQLDDVLGRERVFVVWCVQSHPIAPLVAEVRATGELATRDGCTTRRIELEKRGRP